MLNTAPLKNSTRPAPIFVLKTDKTVWLDLPPDTDRSKIPPFARWQYFGPMLIRLEFEGPIDIQVYTERVQLMSKGRCYEAPHNEVIGMYGAGVCTEPGMQFWPVVGPTVPQKK